MTRIPPGDCITGLRHLNTLRLRAIRVTQLPPRDVHALHTMLDSLRHYVTTGVYVGPMVEGAMDRMDRAVDAGDLGQLQKADLRVLATMLLTVPTSVRGAA